VKKAILEISETIGIKYYTIGMLWKEILFDELSFSRYLPGNTPHFAPTSIFPSVLNLPLTLSLNSLSYGKIVGWGSILILVSLQGKFNPPSSTFIVIGEYIPGLNELS